MEEEPVIQASSNPQSSLSFDVLLHTSIHKDSSGAIDYSLSLQPELTSSTTTLRFSLDPFHILSYRRIPDDSIRHWVSYASGFIDEIRYRTFNEVASVALSRDVIIPGDPFGITSAITNSFKASDKNLGFLHTLSAGIYSHTISASDLSLSDEAGRELLSADISIELPTYPFSFGAALLVDTESSLEKLDETAYYPEVYLRSPIYFSDSVSLSLQVTAALRFIQNGAGRPDGWGLAVTLPLSLDRFFLDTGAAFTAGNLQYGTYLNGYTTERANNDTVLFFTRALYENRYFSAVGELQIPMDVETITMIKGEEFASIELSTKLFGISFGGGFRSTGVFSGIEEAFRNDSESFISMGYENEAISTKLSLYFGQSLKPEVALTATMSGRKALTPSTSSDQALPYWLTIELFTGYVRVSDAGLNLMPVITFGGEETHIGFRLPFYLSTTSSGLITTESDPWYNFGIGADSTFELVFDAFTDVFTIIDSIKIGSLDSPFFLISERDNMRNDGMFASFGSYTADDPISLMTGFNITGRASSLIYADNLENPEVISLLLDVYPMGSLRGPVLSLEASADVRVAAEGSYDVRMPVSISFGGRMFSSHLGAEALVGTYFDFGKGYFNQHLFSMNDLEAFYGFRGDVSFPLYSIALEGGMRKGRARSVYFDAFYFQHMSESWTLEDEYSTSEDFRPYGIISFTLNLGGLSLDAAYSSDDIRSLLKGEDGGDRFSLDCSYTRNGLTVRAAYLRRNFLSSITSASSYEGLRSYLVNEDTIISLSLEKSYGHLTFSGMIYTAPETKSGEKYLNVPVKGDYDIGFSLMTSVRF